MATYPYTPLVEINGGWYFPEPYSGPLSPTLTRGLVAVGLLASISVASTLSLTVFILCRMYRSRKEDHATKFVGRNQYVLLVLNLLIGDMQQSTAFLFSFHWLHEAHILAPSPPCFAQGWLLHSGDVSSGLFVLTIAIHTYYTAVHGRRVGHVAFAGIIAGVWLLAYTLTAIGPIMRREKYFVRAGAWCWVSSAYENDRLWLHYIWVFLVEFGTVVIYFMTFILLRRKTRHAIRKGRRSDEGPSAATMSAINRVTMLMVLYPFAYVLLTLPLSIGRMWSMAHGGQPISERYSLVAGCMITSCGWVDSLLYSLTRSRLLTSTQSRSSTRSPSVPAEGIVSQTKTITITTVARDSVLVASEDSPNSMHQTHHWPTRRLSRSGSVSESLDAMLFAEELNAPPDIGYNRQAEHAEMERRQSSDLEL